MEILTILLLVILLVLVILVLNQNGSLTTEIARLKADIRMLRDQVAKGFADNKVVVEKEKVEKEVSKEIPIEKLYSSPGFTVVEEKKEIPVQPAPVIIPPVQEEKKEELPLVEKELPPVKPVETVIVEETIVPPVQQPVKKPVHQPGFSERHPDMEKFIGENLVSKIGIAILVLAIGFFVKYAIDNNWIGPVGRVAIGIVCGGILAALGYRMRNNYKSFSSVLTGGSIAVFYFTIALAYQKFQLFGQAPAFVIMSVITIFAVLLSLLYNRQELAVIALIGGFCAPFLVSNGSGNYKVLFTYLIILNAGILFIAYNKAWRLLNLLCFVFTIGIFGAWLLSAEPDSPVSVWHFGFLFATIFYLLFFFINIAHNTREQKKFIASDFTILLANTGLYFSAGLYCLSMSGLDGSKGIFTASLGVFNLAASYLLFRKQNIDKNILYLLTGITLTFVSLTAPIQLHGNNITLFWASEAVLLYWLYTKSGIAIIRLGAGLVWLLMFASLVMDWAMIYDNYEAKLAIIFNKGFVTTIFAGSATYMLYLIRSREQLEKKNGFFPEKNILRIVAIVLFFAAGALEINWQFSYYFPGENYGTLYLLLYTICFISGFVIITGRIKRLEIPWKVSAVLLSVCVLFYLLCIPVTFLMQKNMLELSKGSFHFNVHWIIAMLTGMVLYKIIGLIRQHRKSILQVADTFAWVICTITVVWLSTELMLLCNKVFYAANNPLENVERIFIKTGLPILWGLCSFAFMWLGMKHKYRTLRIISLSLFTITLLKLFIFDIRDIPAGGKIAAFFCLGVLLLVVSFMYQRLKKIIIEDEEKTA